MLVHRVDECVRTTVVVTSGSMKLRSSWRVDGKVLEVAERRYPDAKSSIREVHPMRGCE